MLDKINNANDLKKLNIEEKYLLADDIRKYILDIVSKNGGHLASNLGVVELTIALESVFDPNKDKIIWDVGHQSYVHKIINGRKDSIKTLRKMNGIAGFPKTSESPTDCFNTGHSSTSISAALGIAKARDLKKEKYSVVAVIGDGALTGGMALEALNHAGSSKTNLIVILNDNEMSISKNIGGINEILTKLRSKKKYNKSNDKWKKRIKSIPIIGNKTATIVSKLKDAIKQLIIPGMYFEEIGFKYLGPIDGHNIEEIEEILSEAKELEEPILIHIITKKGKGYEIAEQNPDKFHSTSSFDLKTGLPIKEKQKDYSKVFGDKLVSMAKDNDKIVAITAAMKDGTGLKDFANIYPNRFFDVGIAEQHALTFASGLAKEGMIPFVSIYSSFYQRGYDQVIHDICMQNLPVIMCVDRAGLVGNDGETHQGLYDLSFFKLIPNLTIMAPKDFIELEQMMDYAITLNKPVVIRYPRGSESKIKFTKHQKITLGKSEILNTGTEVSIITIGNMTSLGMEIVNELKKYNISCDLINTRFIKPLDTSTIKKSIIKTKLVITIEDNTIVGGLSSSIKELLIDNNINTKIKSYAFPDNFIEHGSIQELQEKYGITKENIIKYIKKTLKDINKDSEL